MAVGKRKWFGSFAKWLALGPPIITIISAIIGFVGYVKTVGDPLEVACVMNNFAEPPKAKADGPDGQPFEFHILPPPQYSYYSTVVISNHRSTPVTELKIVWNQGSGDVIADVRRNNAPAETHYGTNDLKIGKVSSGEYLNLQIWSSFPLNASASFPIVTHDAGSQPLVSRPSQYRWGYWLFLGVCCCIGAFFAYLTHKVDEANRVLESVRAEREATPQREAVDTPQSEPESQSSEVPPQKPSSQRKKATSPRK